MPLRSGIHIFPTYRWYFERRVWLIAGGVLLAATAPASVAVASTGFCFLGNALARIGFTPMPGRPVPGRGDQYFIWSGGST